MTHDVIVIGAGVSGLACADDLAGQGFDVQVLERQIRTGGNASSRRFGGFLMEHGPTTLNAAFPKAMGKIRALGLEPSIQELGPEVRNRYLRDERGLYGISTHPLGFFTSNYLSVRARLSMAAEILRPRRTGGAEETIHQFTARRFGTGFADKVIAPMAAGIFMGDSRSLSIDGAFPRLVELERKYGSIMRGVLAAKRGSEPGRRLLSWDGGLGTLPRTLTGRLGNRVHTGVTVTSVTRTTAGFRVATVGSGTLFSRALVLAVQPHVAAALLENLDPDAATATGDIAAPPIAVVYFGFRREQVQHPLDGLGFLTTKIAGQVISGVQFASTMFRHRAPDGHVAISCYVGGARAPAAAQLPDKELTGTVLAELSGLLGINGAPVVARCHRWPRGLPQYNIGHTKVRQVIGTSDQRVPGLFISGNFLHGVSVTNCLETAADTAAKVQTMLRTSRRAGTGNPAFA